MEPRSQTNSPNASPILAYLSCSEELRSRLRERLERPVLDWLEEIGAVPSGAKALAAVQAVLALEGARAALDRGEAQEALDTVSSQMRMLRGLGEARRCIEQAESQLAAGRRARARELLEAACAAYEAARREDAKELLEAIDLGELTARERSQAEELGARIDRVETMERWEREYERHLAAEDLLGALERAEQLAEDAVEEASGRRWAGASAGLRRWIPAAWKVEVTSDALPLAELRAYSPPFTIEIPQIWLDDDGREIVLVSAWSRWLFIRVVDVDAAAVVERISLCIPEPLGRLMPVICRDGDRLRIIGQNGQFLELARRGWEILRWRSLRDLLPERAVIDQTLLPAGSPYLWFVFRMPPSQDWRSCVVDLRTWRISHRLAATIIDPVLGAGEPRVLSSHLEEGVRLYSARGTPSAVVPDFYARTHPTRPVECPSNL
ncbi:MAG: hypothetical protein GY856_02180 [bacterium]|nr:hypothetical protein [bacterium]